MKLQISLFLTAIVPTLVLAVSKVPACDKRAEVVSEGRPLAGLKSLPPMVYVGKFASYSVENKTLGIRLQGEQSFVKGESRIVCASGNAGKPQSYSMYAPTLIDLTGDKSIGDSYWQFHMIANEKQFGIWNQKSRLFSKTKDLEEGLTRISSQVQIFQISHDEYEMVFTREADPLTEVLSVRFEAFTKIP